ncbi:hypothetical protein D9619_007903 [Psilocybe cf. subviscida]|uniref:Carbohydrate-binding module family 13 protein n=1 Tax=Psilocybe cf. subviscida TaxID=2480587 RepID=A0A8H5ESS7_9AGAR|nr:hypothetical protein D9619_007903 [Psilocybe cf. subviscida]
MHHRLASLSLIISLAGLINGQYSATYLPSNVPAKTENGQAGTNQCGTGSNQNSQCQNAFINSLTDFCLFAPPNPGPDSVIGNTESGTGTRLIPDGAIKGAHFVQTPDFVQVTGIGDLTKINIPAGDAGGELDPHGADGNGNPIGGLVFSSAFGSLEQIHEWTSFVSDTEFCFRACKPGPKAATFCQHIYDVMGCEWNMPANYGAGFESCQGDSGQPMGVYGTSTFHQGQPATPAAHPVPSSSRCQALNTIGNGIAISSTLPPAPPTSSSSHSTTNSGASSTSAAPTTQTNAPSTTVTSTVTATNPVTTLGIVGGSSAALSGLPNAALTLPPSATPSTTTSITLATLSQTSGVTSNAVSISTGPTIVLSVCLIGVASILTGFSFL